MMHLMVCFHPPGPKGHTWHLHMAYGCICEQKMQAREGMQELGTTRLLILCGNYPLFAALMLRYTSPLT